MSKTNDIAQLIKYKNELLDNMYRQGSPDSSKTYKIKTELDSLLFRYYKSLRTAGDQ
jgi:hypothetical protein